MINKFCVLTTDDKIKKLEELINKYYEPNNVDCVIGVKLDDILVEIDNKEIKSSIKYLWMAIEEAVDYEIDLIFNSIKNNNTNLKLKISFTIGLAAKNKNIFESIQKYTGITIKIKQIDILNNMLLSLARKNEFINFNNCTFA